MTGTHPRILVVCSAPMGGTGGTAITLSSLLGGWPADLFGQIYTVETATSVPGHGYFLAPRNAPLDFYARRILTRGRGTLEWGAPTSPGVPVRRETQSARARLHSQMRAIADMSPIRVPRGLRSWVRDYRPELVYSLLGNIRMLTLARTIADCAGVPLVPHFMDDWPTTLYSDGEILGRARAAMNRGLREVVHRAPVGLAISDAMSTEYEARYGIPFLTFGNTVEHVAEGPDLAKAHAIEDPLEFVYVGGLHLERWRSLAALGEALEQTTGTGPLPRLVIHAPEADLVRVGPLLSHLRAVHLGGTLEPVDVAARLASADVLVHVESFDERIREFTRLSLSTKIPQYLASGRPILAIGPAELASIQHIGAIGAGVLVTSADAAQLRDGIAELARSAAARDAWGQRGAAYAAQHYRRENVRAQLAAVLQDAAARRRPDWSPTTPRGDGRATDG